jgi:hypothetical protein
MNDVTKIPGIGRTFSKDLARIGIHTVEDLAGRTPEALFRDLQLANQAEGHATSTNYLYVLRMAVYYADGGREPELLRWSSWSDRAVLERKRPDRSARAKVSRRSQRESPSGPVPTEIVL